MLSSPGIGSGLDIGGIIQSLMAVERKPLVDLASDKLELKTQLSALGKLKSTISSFESTVQSLANADDFLQYEASSSNTEALTVSADENATKGSYRIEVDRLAEEHRLAATGFYADVDTTTIGSTGETMTITVGSDSFVVEYGGKALEDVRDAINEAADNSGVTASILQDDAGYRLTLTADETGSENAISLTYSASDPFSFTTLNDASGTFTTADLDAQLTLEGLFTLTRSSNTVTDAIAGVTLTLQDAGSTTVSVSRDEANTLSLAQKFVGAYNSVITLLTELKSTVLKEDRASLRGIESQFRAVLNSKTGDSDQFSYLFELGVSTSLDGTLVIDTTLFNKAVARDPEGIADMFANSTTGLSARYETITQNLVGPGGLLGGREDSLNSRIRSLDLARDSLEARLVRKEESLVRQFSALDSLVASLNSQSNYLAQQLDQIAAVSKSANKS